MYLSNKPTIIMNNKPLYENLFELQYVLLISSCLQIVWNEDITIIIVI